MHDQMNTFKGDFSMAEQHGEPFVIDQSYLKMKRETFPSDFRLIEYGAKKFFD